MTKRIGILTSGGDAQGMNAAVRAVVRTALDRGVEVYAIYEGYQGLVDDGEYIRRMNWDSVGGILQQGGTVIGSARCEDFRSREGRRRAAKNLIKAGIDGLIVIGGDGSLTGANLFRQEWPALIQELLEFQEINAEEAAEYPNFSIVGLVGSIDNDFSGTDMTIGADSALHRITEAVDAITSTAASHQRTFVVKVMGRNCGYLALMGALATGADWVLIPEAPPDVENWQDVLAERLKAGRKAGRRDSIVIIAEGARDRDGNYIGSSDVQRVLEEKLNEEVRVTVLGHVQRGGRPSAFDRNLSTLMGYEAVNTILAAKPEDEPVVIGIRNNRMTHLPLMESVKKTQAVAEAINAGDYERAMSLRSSSFKDAFTTFKTMVRALPRPVDPTKKRFRIAVMNAGAPAPGMNTAGRAAIRLGLDAGHVMLGIRNGFEGLIDNDVTEMNWMSVSGWASSGGSMLGTTRLVPKGRDLYAIARVIEDRHIDALLIIGGWNAYESAFTLLKERENFPSFNIPMICLPASINNNLPGSEFSIGTDTALNSIVDAVDKIKQSAVATRRVFVVEVMGHYCGYLALMGGMATGAERVYMHEEGIKLRDLQTDVEKLLTGFQTGKRLGLMIRNESANPVYTTNFICSLFEEEGGDVFDVRPAILGHLQQGGDPSPFDRIQATRLASMCLDYLIDQCEKKEYNSAFIGMQNGQIHFHDMRDFDRMIDTEHQRPKDQWWMELKSIATLLAKQGPNKG
ncbi:MAG TPA: 6-phosphofructokinase [Anaerolineales bacterium]|nr:6-phosphofructokinase [Anaerolineales bacterium]HNB36792.1 6-phosphofructokinase [Anaerolineales bacterium]